MGLFSNSVEPVVCVGPDAHAVPAVSVVLDVLEALRGTEGGYAVW